MNVKRVVSSSVACVTLCLGITGLAHAQKDWRKADGPVRMYNTAKKKLMEGKPIVGITISSPDPNIYCAAANSGYDFTWIEMQHSPLTYGDVAKMIYACRGAAAMPFIRVPNAEKIASVPGIDVIFAASTDLGNFSNTRQGQPEYEAMVTKIHDVVLA